MIELMVVLAIIAILLTLVTPRYLGSVANSKEIILKENLSTVRRALDQHFADKGSFPKSLEELVALQYLRSLPFDPITEKSDSWILLGENLQPLMKATVTTGNTPANPPPNTSAVIRDIRSGAIGESRSGGAFDTW
jgi:general secretion pathway protein G